MRKSKKQKKKTQMQIAVVVVIAVVLSLVLAAWYFGFLSLPFLPSAADGLTPQSLESCLIDLQATDLEIFTALETLMGKDLDYITVSSYISTLHMKMYGVTCAAITALPLMEQYEADYAVDGWVSEGKENTAGLGWFAYYEFWGRGDQARFVAAGEGTVLVSTYNYDTVILVASGAITTVEQFLDEMI